MKGTVSLSSNKSSAKDRSAPEILVCKLLLPLHENYPTYHHAVSTAHPDLGFLLLSRMELEGGQIMEDVMVTGTFDPEAMLEELQSGNGVHEAEIMDRQGTTIVFRLVLDATPVTSITRELHLLPRYPTAFDGGVVKLVVVASKEKVQHLYQRLRKFAPGISIGAIRHDSVIGPKSLLTDRQRTIFRVAMDAGYWDVPRRASLTDLAQILSLSKSTVSETLASIESKLVQEARVEHILL